MSDDVGDLVTAVSLPHVTLNTQTNVISLVDVRTKKLRMLAAQQAKIFDSLLSFDENPKEA